MAIASEMAVEIISMDSALVYRGMDIGTAKPSARELAVVPHHLIDIRDPLQPYNAAPNANSASAPPPWLDYAPPSSSPHRW